MAKITPFLWFDHRLEEVAQFYIGVFGDGKILSTSRHGDKVMSMTSVLEGQEFMALNGGPHFKFNGAVSFFVKCETQAQVDHYWNALTANGGAQSQCGWLKDSSASHGRSFPARSGAIWATPIRRKRSEWERR